MQRKSCRNIIFRKRRGEVVIEIILATAIFMIVVSGIIPLYLGVFDTNLKDINKIQADMFLQQGLEAVRSIRDYSFSNLVNGTYGITRSSGYWAFSGSSDLVNKFTRTVTVSDVRRDSSCNIVASGGTVDANTKKINVSINWNYKTGDAAAISSTEYLTNWRVQNGCGQSSNLVIDLSGAYLSSNEQRIVGITLRNIGATPITIDKITPYWTNSELIEEIKIGSIIEWKYNNEGSPDGRQPSGTELDIDNYTLPAYSGVIQLDHFFFTGNMEHIIFTFYVKMIDGSVRYEHIDIGDN